MGTGATPLTFQSTGRLTVGVEEVREVTVELVYFEDCPNWRLARERLETALKSVGRRDAEVRLRLVANPIEAEAAGLRGSPTVLVNGEDPFPRATAAVWSCRLYQNEAGLEGAPSVSGLCEALR